MPKTDGQAPVVDTGISPDTDDLNAFETLFAGTQEEVTLPDEPEEDDEVTSEEDGDTEDSVEESDDEEVDSVEDSDADEDEDSEDDEDDVEEDIVEEKPKKNRKSAKERIAELVAERRAAEARAAALELRLEQLEASREKEDPKPTPKPDKPVEDSFPDPDAVGEDGEPIYPLGPFDPKYVAEVTKYNLKQEMAEIRRQEELKREQEELARAEAALVENWNGRLEETAKALPDLREKIQGLEEHFSDIDPEYGTFLAQTIMGMDRGAEVLYYLADNPEVAESIVSANPVAATIQLGRIEGMLPSVSTETPKKKVSKAPPPPKATRGIGTKSRVAPDTDDLNAFEREFYRR